MISYGKISDYYPLLTKHEKQFPEVSAPLQLRGYLKDYQNLFVLDLIRSRLPKGGRILEVGGGSCVMMRSLLKNLPGKYECWNLDPLDGTGNGPVSKSHAKPTDKPMGAISGVTTVEDRIGAFSEALKDNYFDFIFSVSVFEHIPLADWPTCFRDIKRLLKQGGLTAHSIDLHPLDGQTALDRLVMLRIAQTGALSPIDWSAAPTIDEIRNDPDVLVASPFEYARWLRHMNEPDGPYRRVAAGNSVYCNKS